MIFRELNLVGAYEISLELKGDERGFFARYFCEREFAEKGLVTHWVQMNTSYCKDKGTLRGLHLQAEPMQEVKVLRCWTGAIWDVIVDMRAGSSTFGKWHGVELSAENRKMLYVPKGFAHGFISLTDDAEILYMVSQYYSPEHERTLRWNDPLHGIEWPMQPTVISYKDRKASDWVTE